MCTGVELALIGGALTAGGSYAQYDAVNRKQEGADKAALAGLKRQNAYDAQRGDIYQQALGAAGDQISEEALGTKAAELTADLEQNIAPKVASYTGDGASAPRVLQSVGDSTRQEGDTYLRELANAQGRMNAWGDNMWQFGDEFQDLAWDNDQILQTATNDATLAEKEAQHAYESTGNKTALAGNIASQLGGMLMTQGAFNMGAGALGKAGGAGGHVMNPAGKAGFGVPIQTPGYNPYQTLQPVV